MNASNQPPLSDWADRHLWQIKAFRDLAWILLFVGILVFGYYLRSVFLPVLLSLALAYLFNPLINLAEQRFRMSRPFTISILFLLLTLFILGFMAFFVPLVIEQTITLISRIPTYTQEIPYLDETVVLPEETVEVLTPPVGTTSGDSAAGIIPGATPILSATAAVSPDAIPGTTRPDSATTTVQPATGFAATSIGSSWLNLRDRLIQVLAQYEIDFIDYEQQLVQRARENVGAILQFIYRSLISLFQGTGNALGTFGSLFGDVFGTLTYYAVQLVLMPIYFFVFAWHFDPMIRSLIVYIPKSQRERVIHLAKRMDTAIGNFFRDRIVIAFILGLFFTFGWWMAGVPYCFLLGMITGVLNIVPFASAIGWPIAVLLMYLEVQSTGSPYLSETVAVNGAEGGTWFDFFWFWMTVAGWPTLVFVIGQFLEGWVLVPWFMSQSSDLSVVEVIIVVMVGGAVGGLYGLLLAIPIASCIKILFTDVILLELESWAKTN